MADRSDLINQLAASMGANAMNTKIEPSRYDPKTGTLYCDGMIISKGIADKAVQLFTMLEGKCNKEDPVQREQAMMYRCAIESIKMMQNPNVKSVIQSDANKNLI